VLVGDNIINLGPSDGIRLNNVTAAPQQRKRTRPTSSEAEMSSGALAEKDPFVDVENAEAKELDRLAPESYAGNSR
jgi:hypothetical protein